MADNHCSTLKRQFNSYEELASFVETQNLEKNGWECQAYECEKCGKWHFDIVPATEETDKEG